MWPDINAQICRHTLTYTHTSTHHIHTHAVSFLCSHCWASYPSKLIYGSFYSLFRLPLVYSTYSSNKPMQYIALSHSLFGCVCLGVCTPCVFMNFAHNILIDGSLVEKKMSTCIFVMLIYSLWQKGQYFTVFFLVTCCNQSDISLDVFFFFSLILSLIPRSLFLSFSPQV